MNQALVLILALVWIGILLPGALRSRRGDARTTVGAVGDVLDRRRTPDHGEPVVYRFNEAAAAVLQEQRATVRDAVEAGLVASTHADRVDPAQVVRTGPRVPDVPVEELRVDAARRRQAEALRQQRQILLGLLGVTLVSGAFAVVAGGGFTGVFVVAVVALTTDVVWLRRRAQRRAERAAVVAPIDRVRTGRDERLAAAAAAAEGPEAPLEGWARAAQG